MSIFHPADSLYKKKSDISLFFSFLLLTSVIFEKLYSNLFSLSAQPLPFCIPLPSLILEILRRLTASKKRAFSPFKLAEPQELFFFCPSSVDPPPEFPTQYVFSPEWGDFFQCEFLEGKRLFFWVLLFLLVWSFFFFSLCFLYLVFLFFFVFFFCFGGRRLLSFSTL